MEQSWLATEQEIDDLSYMGHRIAACRGAMCLFGAVGLFIGFTLILPDNQWPWMTIFRVAVVTVVMLAEFGFAWIWYRAEMRRHKIVALIKTRPVATKPPATAGGTDSVGDAARSD